MKRLMKRFFWGLSMFGFAALLSVTVAPSVNAAIITSTTDLFEGATVTDSISVGAGGFTNIFLGANPEAEFTTNVIFPDASVGTVNFVNFSTASPVSIAGVRLTAASDGSANFNRRSMNRFVLKADLNNDSTYETTLIDQAINTDYSLQAGNVASAQSDLDLTFTFASVTAAAFRAEFTQGVYDLGLEGVRVYELDAIAPPGPVVSNATDSGAGSLRQALADATAGATITFDNALSGATINLASTLMLTKNVTIDGSALALPVTLNGQTSVMVMSIPLGVTAVLDSLKIANGVSSVSNQSGGIWNNGGNLTVNRATFDNNSSLPGTWDGGAIYTNNGTLTVSNSTFTNNKARWGSAICARGVVDTTITNSTFHNNSANAQGAIVIAYGGTGILRNNTISGNSALDNNAAFSTWGDSITLSFYNNIMANSTNNLNPTTDCSGFNATFIANEGNLITSNHPSFSCATAAVTTDPYLGVLQNNGGPTMTMALLEGSPAINAGSDANAPAADQRGVARPVGGRSDIGAFESAFALLVVSKAGTGTGTVASFPLGISCGVDCDETFDVGSSESVILTPTPATGSGFTGWSGACTGSGVCEVTMDAAKSVTATFLPLAAKPNLMYAPATNTSGSYKIRWNISATAGATYKLYQSGITEPIYSGPNNYFNVTVNVDGIYNYTVKATKAGYADSIAAGATTSVVLTCGPITNIYAPASNSTGSYKVSWNKSSTAGVFYRLYENGNLVTPVYQGSNNYVNFKGKTAGTRNYTVQAFATTTNHAPSAISGMASTTVTLTCANIAGIYAPANSSTGSYKVSWNVSTPGSIYILEERFNGGIWTEVDPGPGTKNYHVFTAKPAGIYSYRVTATKLGYTSSARGTVTVTVTTPTP